MAYDGPPIHYAIRGGNTPLALQRIRDGADVDYYKPGDGNAVLWAAFMGNFDVLQALVEQGAKLNVVHPHEGKTALDLCKEARCYKLLKDHGAVHVAGTSLTWATYDLDELLKRPAADALQDLDERVRGVLRTRGEEVAYQVREFWSYVEGIVQDADEGRVQEAVSFQTGFWGNLDFLLPHLAAVGDTEVTALLARILKVFGSEYKYFEVIDSARVDLIDLQSATEIVDLLRQVLKGRPRLDQLLVQYIRTHRDLFDKP
jgi:hypothetical protein